MSSESFAASGAQNQTDVYAVHGADPEVLAYAMAKYSRSALSMRESLAEISSQRAEQFLNTFYFQYGHRSIADLAHIAFAVERLSLLAAIVLVDKNDGGQKTEPLDRERHVRQIGDGAVAVLKIKRIQELLGSLSANLGQRLAHGERRARILGHGVSQDLGVCAVHGVDFSLVPGGGGVKTFTGH